MTYGQLPESAAQFVYLCSPVTPMVVIPASESSEMWGREGGKEVRARKHIHRFLRVVEVIKVLLTLNEHHHHLQHTSALVSKTLNFFKRVRGFYLLQISYKDISIL